VETQLQYINIPYHNPTLSLPSALDGVGGQRHALLLYPQETNSVLITEDWVSYHRSSGHFLASSVNGLSTELLIAPAEQ